MDPFLGLLAGGAAAAGYLTPAALKPFAIRALQRRASERRALVLTYDDGPGPETTRRLMQLLAEHSAHASFFVSGRRAQDRPEVVEALVDSGHEVGSHGFDHVHAWRASPWRVAADVSRGAREVARHSPEGAAPFRPPFGKATLATTWSVARAGTRSAWWTHDSGDSFPELPSELPAREELLTRGGVVLLHDLDRSEPRNEYVLRVTEELLKAAPERGLRVMTFGALFE